MAGMANKITGVGTVMVTVADRDRAIDFFVNKLGFEKRTDVVFGEGEAERWVEVAAPGSATAISLVPPRGDAQPGVWTGIAFTTQDVHGDHAALSDRGIAVQEIMGGDGPVPEMFWFTDPEGNSYLNVARQ